MRAAFLEGLRPLQEDPGVELWFADFLAKTPQALVKRLVTALTALLDNPDTVAAQCAFRK